MTVTRLAGLAVGVLCVAGCGSRTEPGAPFDAAVEVEPEASPSCGPFNCNGCCDDAGVCQSGDAQALCGEQGRACEACLLSLDEICNPQPGQPDSRVCWAPCDSRFCVGGCCLADGTCIPTPTDRTCGSIGFLCVDCTATGEVCGTVAGKRTCVSP